MMLPHTHRRVPTGWSKGNAGQKLIGVICIITALSVQKAYMETVEHLVPKDITLRVIAYWVIAFVLIIFLVITKTGTIHSKLNTQQPEAKPSQRQWQNSAPRQPQSSGLFNHGLQWEGESTRSNVYIRQR